jgi:hypothetical protein
VTDTKVVISIEDDCAGGIGWIATKVSPDGTHDDVEMRGGYRNSFVGRAVLNGDMFKKALEYSDEGYAVDIKGHGKFSREIARQDEERLRFQIKDECLF